MAMVPVTVSDGVGNTDMVVAVRSVGRPNSLMVKEEKGMARIMLLCSTSVLIGNEQGENDV